MRVITAKFDSTCYETGRPIKKGDVCVYDPATRRTYASGSPTQQKFTKQEKQNDEALGMIQAEQDAYYDNWYQETYGR